MSNCTRTATLILYLIYWGFIVSKRVKKLACQACKECLVGEVTPVMKASDHDYCGPSTYSQVSSAFTLSTMPQYKRNEHVCF